MRKRRFFTLLALLATLSLVAAACSDDDGGGGGTTGGEETGGEETGGTTGGAVDCEADEFGCVEIAAGQPIEVASLQSISGETASLGTDQVRAIEIAIADRGGELLGHPIELASEDDGCDATVGTTAAQRIVSNPQILGVLGSSCSGAAVPSSEIFAGEGIVMISGSNTSPSLTSDLNGTEAPDHQPIYFRTAHNDIIQGLAAATYAYEELGARAAATVHDGDPYTQGLANAFATAFEDLGGTISLATAVNPGDTDMRPVLTEIAASEPDIVFMPIFQPEADFIVQQSNEIEGLEDTEKLMGADGLLSDTFIELPDTEGMYFSGPAVIEGGGYDEFVAKYEEAYGEPPIQAFHAHSYDAANILLDAIEAVAVDDGSGNLTVSRTALLEQVAGTSGFQGLTGTLTCDEFGDCADPEIDVLQNSEAAVTIGDVRANVLFTYDPSP
jgi:branched-chain amino acid transport system substrate-binding protein